MPELDDEEDSIIHHSDSDEECKNEDIQSPSPRKKIPRQEESQASTIPSIDDPCTPQKSPSHYNNNSNPNVCHYTHSLNYFY